MPLVVRLLVGVVLAGALVLSPSAGAAGSATYEDERAEEAGAPDIQRVTVSNDAAGRVTFRVDIPTHPVLTEDMRLRIWFSDGHPTTGLTNSGADGFVLVDGFLFALGSATLYRCQDSVCTSPADSPGGFLDFSYASGMTVTTSAALLGVRLDLGGRLDFSVDAGAGFAYDPVTQQFDVSNVLRDFAPAEGWWSYTVRVAPSALVARSVTVSPAPRAGRQVVVRMHVVAANTEATITSGSVRCHARVGASALRAVSSRFARDRATCVYRIPARASGKALRGSISVAHAGKTVTRSFTRAIR